MENTVDLEQYTLIPYKVLNTLEEKLHHLLNGDILLIKNYEQKQETDVLVRLIEKKHTVTQISYDLTENEHDPRYWITFNVGLNDLSLFTTYVFEEELFKHTNKFMVNDLVLYQSEDGTTDSAIIEEVYVSKDYPERYAYRLSREPDTLYKEESLLQNPYMYKYGE